MSRPNVLLVCADHWGGRHLRAAGHPVVMTPTIDQLAKLGTLFTQATSACPICVPARRSLMTGLSPRAHGDRCFDEAAPFPDVPTMAQCFRDGGYQAGAVGKLHVSPPRNRIGFDDVILNEEGRRGGGRADDWELYLAEQGYAGREYAAGACNNDYVVAPWHLPDEHHQTNWAAREMCRTIRRRDPRKPGFWYLAFTAPHPPMWPLKTYLDLYRDVVLDDPLRAAWSDDAASRPYKVRTSRSGDSLRGAHPHERDLARRAFYAMITHVDHQIRVVLGTLREEGLLDNTVVAFTSDHGDMLGDHGMWGKQVMYESSCRVPFLVVPPASDPAAARGVRDDRLTELRDVMPTLLELAGLPVPPHVEGVSALTGERRKTLYGEHGEGALATRMLRDERHKLIYYPEGSRFQLFDLRDDPGETADLIDSAAHAEIRTCLQSALASHLYGGDEVWVREGEWLGIPVKSEPSGPNFTFSGQRGLRFL